ncbi:hypothetical protein PR048_009202 [Dryococelus australis]|uniref:Uncharacterized protein n=1 Tax=Dryococelus australis TaxID=614101 RepID=A0ABQ9I002_9NEOP|nr:hypothetical protein PR048_009202 [Dryococelus australis]
MINIVHIARKRYTHQVTAGVLYSLQKEAYGQYIDSTEDEIPLEFMEWHKKKYQVQPQFKFCDLTLILEIAILQFIHSIRQANFDMYVESMLLIRFSNPWFFSLDQKSNLIPSLTSFEDTTAEAGPTVQEVLLDDAAVVNMLNPISSRTLQDYITYVYQPYLKMTAAHVERMDVIWDRHLPESLKNAAREKRGSGARTHAAPNTKMSNNCPCNHDEADTRLIFPTADAVARGCKAILLRTVDTDVLVLVVDAAQQLVGEPEIWTSLGTGKNHKFIAAHTIARSLGPQMSSALPVFHAFSGCDVVSAFFGKGNKTAWETGHAFPEAISTFLKLSHDNITGAMNTPEKFVVLVYDKSSSDTTINSARTTLFN